MEPGPVLPEFESQLLPFPDWVIMGKLLNFCVSVPVSSPAKEGNNTAYPFQHCEDRMR